MFVDETVTGIIALLAGYVLGSIPSAYLITRWVTGKDIRRLGGGNVGGLNTLREVGVLPAVAVILVDLAKGVAAVAVAYWLLRLTDLSRPWVLLAGLASVVGHNWMVWLRFSGGRGVATTIGTLAVVFPLYGYWPGIPIFLVILAIPLVITHNIAFAFSIALVSLPVIAWLGMNSGLFVVWSVVTGVIVGLKSLPAFRTEWAHKTSKRDLIFDRRGKSRR